MLRDETDWTLHLEVDAVLRGQGMDPAQVRARSPRIVDAAETAITQGRGLLRPRVVSREFHVLEHGRDRLALDGGEFLCGERLAERLAAATRLVVIGATVGDDLQRHAGDVSQTDPILALGLQGVGAAGVEDLAVQACRGVSSRAREAGQSGVLCWPGSVAWPNDAAQPQIFALLAPEEAGGEQLRLDAALVVRPVTSLTFAVGVGPAPEGDEEGPCEEAADAGAPAGSPHGLCNGCSAIPVCNFTGC